MVIEFGDLLATKNRIYRGNKLQKIWINKEGYGNIFLAY
jgi:hypothetical protein